MLQYKKKTLAPVTASLRPQDVQYRSSQVPSQGIIYLITSVEDGTRKLQEWGIPTPKPQKQD
ncbi:Hypothetical predicted protein [Pelobates cultripes]|uniref:Uncharacterized protein n=1 Tax=Pelobates cultripes TaxID=61616 RepID=A0AAD1T2A3_PELCU|nr:Hypothetical predicted protein [Pelobates cultripes]